MTYKDNIPIPRGVDFNDIKGLTEEEREALRQHRPPNLGHAKHTQGISDKTIKVLEEYLRTE